MDDFEKFEELKAAGESPEMVWASAESDGLNQISLFRMIRKVFGLSLVEAKEVAVRARTGQQYDRHTETLLEELRQVLDE